MKKLRAYHNKESLKAAMLKEVGKHEKADQIEQGTYGRQNGKWKGCAVGCSLRSLAIINGETLKEAYSTHSDYEKGLGIPQILAKLEDRIFEGLPEADSKKWPRQFLSAINVGADLSSVWDKFALWLLEDKKDGVIKFAKREQTKKAIQGVIELFKKKLSGKKVIKNQWRAAAAAAYAAAADAAAAAAAAYADDAAADDAAAAAYAADAAHKNHYQKMAKKLLQLLKEAKC